MHRSPLKYLTGFRNHHTSEAVAGALPKTQNSPQRCPYGLYAEQFSGTAFTAPRHQNLFNWFYRIRPSVAQSPYTPLDHPELARDSADTRVADPNQMRWNPKPYPDKKTDFIDSLFPMAVNGDVMMQTGCSVYVYAFNVSMNERFFYDADGELLIVPQEGALRFRTEMGELGVLPGEIVIIPRGLKFQVLLEGEAHQARGYICENHGAPFELPGLGPIGANGLANTRHFLSPEASYEHVQGDFELVAKLGGQLWVTMLDHSPLDVVAWHGNYAPSKYDLANFNTINTVSFDHPDPSIFTVLTSPSNTVGMANVDFVIFPPRWMVAAHTFRPPYFHRNLMSEFMGLIHGQYDAKAEGFIPGGASLHNCMSPHGPDAETFAKAQATELNPQYLGNSLAFMFESRYVFCLTKHARQASFRQPNYPEVWTGLKSHFDRNKA